MGKVIGSHDSVDNFDTAQDPARYFSSVSCHTFVHTAMYCGVIIGSAKKESNIHYLCELNVEFDINICRVSVSIIRCLTLREAELCARL